MKAIKGIDFDEELAGPNGALFVVRKKPDKSQKASRFLFIMLYVLFTVGYCVLFLVITKIPYVLAILPILVWMLYFFTWNRLWKESAYVVDKGYLYIYRVNGRNRATLAESIHLSDSFLIAPATEEYLASLDSEVQKDYSTSPDCEDRYVIAYSDDGRKTASFFVASQKLLTALKYFAKEQTIVTQTSR